MPRVITDEQELLDFINNRPSKKKKMTIAIIVIVLAAALAVFVMYQIHKANEFNREVKAAETALEAGDYQEAVEKYDIVIKQSDNDAALYEGRGDAYVGLKKYPEAIDDYHTAIDLDKSNETLYKKGVKAGLKTGDNRKAMVFINDMKENIGEEQGETLRKETFVYPAEKALNKKLRSLQDTAKSNKDAYVMTLQSYVYFDIDHDGVKELLAESGRSISREKNLKIYAYKKGKVKTMLDKSEYGVVSVKAYDKTRSLELLFRGNGTEEYRYYKVGNSSLKKQASRSRRSTSAGAYSDGQWTNYGSGDYDVINSSEFDKITSGLTKGKARSTEIGSWKTL